MSPRANRPRNLPALLLDLHTQEHTGTVVVSGSPGSRIHLRAGRVQAVETPGSPGVETLLRGSGRLTEEAWSALCAAAESADGDLAAHLEERGLLSRHTFDVICTSAVFDAAFVTALTVPDGWEVTEEATPVPWSGPSFAPRRLAAETTRRLDVLTAHWGAPAPEVARTPVLAAANPPQRIPPRYAALLQAANGRRTPRDIAFALGRGTYAVMLDLARMRELGLLRGPTGPGTPRPSTAPRRPDRRSPGRGRSASLPRRNPGSHRADPDQ
ncbi:hypothetical protein [Streptomyces sp. NPDC007929]|uniref:hypothetical protein n=1 Tax=unclassified Streptomyces TaxID=2593676 RepID=UPI0036E78667